MVLARRSEWERLGPSLERDPKLSQKPLPIARQPEKRPISDPRPFQEQIGNSLKLFLRNGLNLNRPLRAYGPFDLIVGDEGEELFVPLHAIARWEVES